jgi:predicted nucleotidyltransferase
MELAEEIIDEAVRLTVDAVKPLRIIVFGSAARGEMGEDSDLDLLVVMPDGTHRRETARTVRSALLPIEMAIDVVVATEDDLVRYGDNFSLVYYPALREGRTVYAA